MSEPQTTLEPQAAPQAVPQAVAMPASVARTEAPAAAVAATPSPAPRANPLAQIQTYANRALVESIYRLRRVGTSGLAGLALVVAAVAVFVANNLPQSSAVAALKAQVLQLTPLGKVAATSNPAGTVLAALPRRDDAPTVVGKIFAQASAAGVELTRGQYEYLPARDGVAARYRMTFPVHTTYPQLRDFMNRTLATMPAVAVDGLRIERKKVGDEEVDAELKLSAYVRSDP